MRSLLPDPPPGRGSIPRPGSSSLSAVSSQFAAVIAFHVFDRIGPVGAAGGRVGVRGALPRRRHGAPARTLEGRVATRRAARDHARRDEHDVLPRARPAAARSCRDRRVPRPDRDRRRRLAQRRATSRLPRSRRSASRCSVRVSAARARSGCCSPGMAGTAWAIYILARPARRRPLGGRERPDAPRC